MEGAEAATPFANKGSMRFKLLIVEEGFKINRLHPENLTLMVRADLRKVSILDNPPNMVLNDQQCAA